MNKRCLIFSFLSLLVGCSPKYIPSSGYYATIESSIDSMENQYDDYKKSGGSLSFFDWQVEILSIDPNGHQREGTYVVYFVDGDANIITFSVVEPGSPAIYNGSLPTKSDRNKNGIITKFIFSKWDKDFDYIQSNMVVHALFKESPNKYFDVKFQDYDGSIISESAVMEGHKPIEPERPSRKRQINGHRITDFKFTGWDKDITPITSPITFQAVYNETKWEGYRVNWVSPDGTLLKTDFYEKGSTPKYDSNVGSVPFYYDSKYNYIFDSWDREITNLSSDETIKEIAVKIPLLQNGDTGLQEVDISDKKSLSVLTSIAKSYGAKYGSKLIFVYKSKRYTWHEDGSITFRPPMKWHLLSKKDGKILVTSEELYDFSFFEELSSNLRKDILDYEEINHALNNYLLGDSFMGICFEDESAIVSGSIDNSFESRLLNESDIIEPDSHGKLFLLSAKESLNYKEKLLQLGETKPFLTRSYSASGDCYQIVNENWDVITNPSIRSLYYHPCLWFSLD